VLGGFFTCIYAHTHTHGDSFHFILESIVIIVIDKVGVFYIVVRNHRDPSGILIPGKAVCRRLRGRSRSLPLLGGASFPFRFIPQHGMLRFRIE
jgi:hypothetical protein